ncbi:MAG: hypothetical protein K2K09_03645, partial [Lachnospiraceae bacterium]|nr:hypothetical protein [Lachnospiraceae bacterium]
WRIVLGNDRHTLGEFAEYIIDSIKKNKKRIEILEALIWAQEHQNQIHYLLSNASNGQEAVLQLMNKYNFDYDQSQAIIDMRLKAFCDEEKERCKNELDKLLDVEKLYPEI